jgi:5-methylcytosine-specific restriction endonuclease McrA
MSSELKWKKIQSLIFNRDNFKCCNCGSDKKIGIHHKDNSGDQKHCSKSNNSLENLITLCQSCHSKEHWKQAKAKGFSNIYELYCK